MSTRNDPAESRTGAASESLCHKCKGAGVIITRDAYRKEAICCDQCGAGNRIWSRLLSLVADMDVPTPISARPEWMDSIIRHTDLWARQPGQ